MELVVLEEKGLSIIEEVERGDVDAKVVERVLTLELVLLEEKGLSVIEEVEKVNDDAKEELVLNGTGLMVMDEVTVTVLELEGRKLIVCKLVLLDV